MQNRKPPKPYTRKQKPRHKKLNIETSEHNKT